MNKTLLKNGLVFTGEGKIKPLDIIIEGSQILKVGENLSLDGGNIINLKEALVLPGLIDAHCHIGIFETGVGPMGVDGNEDSVPATPELRGIDGVNPFDKEFEHCQKHGVTLVATGPGSSNPIGGTFVALKTWGKTFDDMVVKDPLAMKIAFGENPKSSFGVKGKSPITRMSTASIIRKYLSKAKDYIKNEDAEYDEGLENLAKVIRKEIPLKAHCHRADDILCALRIAKEFDVDITLDHCSEGHLIPDQLSYAKGVIIGPLLGFPQKAECVNQTPAAGKILFEHHVKFAIMSDLPATHCFDITRAAGECVREGLPMEEALAAITSNAAEILGFGDSRGKIKPGYKADLGIWSANPVESLSAKCLLTIIEGETIYRNKDLFSIPS